MAAKILGAKILGAKHRRTPKRRSSTRQVLSVRVTPETREEVQQLSLRTGVSQARVIETAVRLLAASPKLRAAKSAMQRLGLAEVD